MDRKWNDVTVFDYAVGLGFDFVFLPDATTLELKMKMDRYLTILEDIDRFGLWELFGDDSCPS